MENAWAQSTLVSDAGAWDMAAHGRAVTLADPQARIALLEAQVTLLREALLAKGVVNPEELEELLHGRSLADQHPMARLELLDEPIDTSPVPEASRWHGPHGQA